MKRHFFSDSNPDVILTLSPEQGFETNTTPVISESIEKISNVPEKLQWVCHKEVLKVSSNYFNSIFDTQFQESEASLVFLPRGIFAPTVLDEILGYMYNKTINQVDPIQTNEERLERLEYLETVYLAADYLSMNQLCLLIKEQFLKLVHGLVCYCDSCAYLIPHLISFTGSNQQSDPNLIELTQMILKLLIQDPEKTLPSFWSNENLGYLFAETEDLHNYLEAQLLEHVSKNNAIETLHGCFLANQVDSERSPEKRKEDYWLPLIRTLKRLQHKSSTLLADQLEFFCTKYPKLLSCVDGITYSFDFLDYLFNSILSEISEKNACSLYKSIQRNLLYRDSVQQNPNVKKMLVSLKQKILQYISINLDLIKRLDLIEKSVVEQLAQDLSLPIHTLLIDHEPQKSHKSNTLQQKKILNSNQSNYKWNKKLRSRICNILFGQPTLHFKVGQRVQLTNRPIETFGVVSYVGKLDDKQKEQYLGIELDRSVGSTDGSMNGKQYFTTTTNKGIFVKPSQVILV